MKKANSYRTYGRTTTVKDSVASVNFDKIMRHRETSESSPFATSDSSVGSVKDEEPKANDRPRRRCTLGKRVIVPSDVSSSWSHRDYSASRETQSSESNSSDCLLVLSPSESMKTHTLRSHNQPKKKTGKKVYQKKKENPCMNDKENLTPANRDKVINFSEFEEHCLFIESPHRAETAPQSSTPNSLLKNTPISRLPGIEPRDMNVSNIDVNQESDHDLCTPRSKLLGSEQHCSFSTNVTLRRSSRKKTFRDPSLWNCLMKDRLHPKVESHSDIIAVEDSIDYEERNLTSEETTESDCSKSLYTSVDESDDNGSHIISFEQNGKENLFSGTQAFCDDEDEDSLTEGIKIEYESYEEGTEGEESNNDKEELDLEENEKEPDLSKHPPNCTLYYIADVKINLERVEEEEEEECFSFESSVSCQEAVEESFYDKLACSSFCEDVEVLAEHKLLTLCDQNEFIRFSTCIPQRMMSECVKIGEGVYGEVFRSASRGHGVAIKIVPMEGNFVVNDCPQKRFEEVLPEAVIAKELSDLALGTLNRSENFCQVNRISCVQDNFPDQLLKQWDEYTKRKQSENDRPDMFPDDQLFMVFEFADGGSALENFKFANHTQAFSALRQVVYALAVAEAALKFEHRDLHIGNILVKTCKEDTVSFILEENEFTFPSEGVFATIIDFTISRLKKDGCAVFCDISTDDGLFEGTGDIQFDVYRNMREENNNDWSKFCPHSNILWVHYVCEKLNTVIKYKETGRGHRDAQRRLRNLSGAILEFQNCRDLAMDMSLWVL